ncbi:hypothetical protein BDI4_180013 [Burkholderia diffusa]|nr:hypothetical protein BDI4_180013 [Burkholderia diffusa]
MRGGRRRCARNDRQRARGGLHEGRGGGRRRRPLRRTSRRGRRGRRLHRRPPHGEEARAGGGGAAQGRRAGRAAGAVSALTGGNGETVPRCRSRLSSPFVRRRPATQSARATGMSHIDLTNAHLAHRYDHLQRRVARKPRVPRMQSFEHAPGSKQ